MGIEEQGVLRMWAVEERFWQRREGATIQIVGRRDIEIEQEVEIKVEGLEQREKRQAEARKEKEAEEDVAIIWRQEEEKEEPKPRAVVTSAVSNNGRKMLCKVCDISFQGRPYSDYQARAIESTSRPDPHSDDFQEHIQTHRDKGGQFSCTHPGCGKIFKAW